MKIMRCRVCNLLGHYKLTVWKATLGSRDHGGQNIVPEYKSKQTFEYINTSPSNASDYTPQGAFQETQKEGQRDSDMASTGAAAAELRENTSVAIRERFALPLPARPL